MTLAAAGVSYSISVALLAIIVLLVTVLVALTR
jgi:hypothetical protein